jgi:SAM-dependent methyltransferase
MTSGRTIGACRLCGGVELTKIISFGDVPLGNDLRQTQEDAKAAAEYPLELLRCSGCGHFQLGFAVSPTLLYATNYTYLSGIGPSFVRHFDGYAEWALQRCALAPGALVVDVGSNDGTALAAFKKRGLAVCGVDPAQMPAEIANKNGIPTFNTFFNDDAVSAIVAQHGQADYVTSHNVLAHVDDLAGTFRAIHRLLKPGGFFGFEIGYFRDVFNNGYFDTIYHEHLDYHHAAPLVLHLTGLGFEILDLSTNAIQGGSLRLLMRKSDKPGISAQAQDFLNEEHASPINDPAALAAWGARISETMAQLNGLVRERAAAGKRIVGFGAPTKATLLLKMAELDGGDIVYIVEDNALKTGRFLPRTAIPIFPSSQLTQERPDVLLVLAWNFSTDILSRLKGTLPGTEAIVPLPHPKVTEL